jgi:hypothetical protein
MTCSIWNARNMAAAPRTSNGQIRPVASPEPSPASTSDGPRPVPAPRQPPYASSVGGPCSARRQGCTHAPATAGPGRQKGRSPPGPDPVPLERLRQLQRSGGQLSPRLCPSAFLRRSCPPCPPSCPLGRRRRRPSTGLTGTRRGGLRIDHGGLRPRGARGTRRLRWMTSGRHRRLCLCRRPRRRHADTAGRAGGHSGVPSLGAGPCGLIPRSSSGCQDSSRLPRVSCT